MQDELNLLFTKINQLIEAVAVLRQENSEYRVILSELELTNDTLLQKIEQAQIRLDNLICHLPPDIFSEN